jgi:hypothetical protein
MKTAYVSMPFLLALASCGVGPDGSSADSKAAAPERTATVAQADSIKDQILKAIPPGVKTIGELASTAASVYSGAKTALDILTALGQALGFLDTPVPIDAQIAALKSDVDALAGTLSWQMSQDDRQHRMATLEATLVTLNMLRIQGLPVTPTSDGVFPALQSVFDAEAYGTGNTSFLRLFKSSIYSDWWWGIVGAPGGAPSDEVYDWRIGVPELMQLIDFRLQIIATVDPNFRQDGAYHDEFLHHLNALQQHFQAMVGGVKCGFANETYNDFDNNMASVQFGYACGDVASGAIVNGQTTEFDTPICPTDCSVIPCTTDPNCPGNLESQQLYLTQAVPGMENLRQQLLAAMPLTEMQQMMNNLWTYANQGSDEEPLAASTWGGNRLDVFYRDQAGALRHKARDDSGAWLGTENLGGSIVGAPSAASWAQDRIDVFVKGTDNAVYHQWGTSAGMSNGYEGLGGQIVDTPHVVSWGPGRLDVFVNGTGNQLFDQAWDMVSQPWWGGWWMLSAGSMGTPSPVAWAPNRLDIFSQGMDASLEHVFWDGSQWRGPESLGGTLASRPAVASWGPNRLDVFALGTDHALYHKASSGGPFSDWESLGGTWTSAPSVVSWGSGRLDIFVRGTDGALWHDWFDDSLGGWGSFESLGGWIEGQPVALAPAPQRLNVFVVDGNQGLEHRYFDGNGWGGYDYIGDGIAVTP